MTASLLSILSILIGIVAALFYGKIVSKHSMGIIGNSIAGVFGSIFFIKSLGRLGFNPSHILKNGEIDGLLLLGNFILSITGAILAVYLAKTLYHRMNKP